MKLVKVRNKTRDTDLGGKIRVASSLIERTIGLLATPSLILGEGLWISPCPSVHTFFMRYPIDILFVDANNRVLALQSLEPWRLSRWVSKSRGVLELPAGTTQKTQTQTGDQLHFEDVT